MIRPRGRHLGKCDHGGDCASTFTNACVCFLTGEDKVDVSIPKTLATGSKLFARLTVTVP